MYYVCNVSVLNMNNIMFIPTKKSSLKEWLYYIENLNYTAIHLTLKRVREIAIYLKLIHPGRYVILVGGTNGKGTTCCLLESILLNSNIKVGLYTSPHLLRYNERVRICGKELPDYVHVQAMSIIEEIRSDHIKLTYFEFVTLSALYIFKKENLDVIILEVGLGGRLDATNIVDADVSVITNVDIDHTEFLGINRDMIAQEKSGIFRINKPAIIGDINFPIIADEIIENWGSILFMRGRDWNYSVDLQTWSWEEYKDHKLYSLLPLPIVPIENAAVALSVLYWLPFSISRAAISDGLKTATLPGRFQVIQKKPLLILDVGHNPNAAKYLIRRVSSEFLITGKVRMVIGMLKNKDFFRTLNCLNSLVDIWYISVLNTPLSADLFELSNCLASITNNVYCFDNILSAWNQAMLDTCPEDCVIVFGSFYAVSPILKKLIDY